MSNNITIELCAEDRARLDRLADALERRACDKCVEAALAAMHLAANKAAEQVTMPPDPMPAEVREALAKAMEDDTPAETPQEPAGATEAETPATTQAPEEEPAGEADASATEPVVTAADIFQRCKELIANGKRAEARDIVQSYGVTKISDIPADKCAEVMAKLNALEG